MKKIFILAGLICFYHKAFAQDYTPMLEMGKIWNYHLLNDTGGGFDFDLTVTETVEINGVSYYHIVSSNNNDCDRFLREDIEGKKVYNLLGGEEYVLYDFNLDIGDTIIIYGMPRTIIDIGYGDFFGMENLRYYLFDNTMKLIEGVGFESTGMADAFVPGCLYASPFETVQLINMNNLSNNEITSNTISVYPNPVNDFVHIENSTPFEIMNVKVYSVLGKLVLSRQCNSESNQIDLSNLTNGTYRMQIETENACLTKTIIKISE